MCIYMCMQSHRSLKIITERHKPKLQEFLRGVREYGVVSIIKARKMIFFVQNQIMYIGMHESTVTVIK